MHDHSDDAQVGWPAQAVRPAACQAAVLRAATLVAGAEGVWVIREVQGLEIRVGMRLPRGASGARMSYVLRLLELGGHAGLYRAPVRRKTHADENQASPSHHLPRSG